MKERLCQLKIRYISCLSVSTIQFNSIQFNLIQSESIRFNSIQFNSIQFNSIQFNSQLNMKRINGPGFRFGFSFSCPELTWHPGDWGISTPPPYTHADKYLLFNSHHPICHKKDFVH